MLLTHLCASLGYYIFKLIKYILLPVLNNYASLSPYQFGYRQNSSTIVATALLKETINKYVSGGSSVHTCFYRFK